MTAQEYALLSADEKKGFINVTDETGNPVTADDIAYDNNVSIKEKIDSNAVLTTTEQITTNSTADAILSLSASQYALLSAFKIRDTLDTTFAYVNGFGYAANGNYSIRIFDGNNQPYENKTINLRLFYCKMPS